MDKAKVEVATFAVYTHMIFLKIEHFPETFYYRLEVVGPIRLPWWGRLQYYGADVMVVMEQVVE